MINIDISIIISMSIIHIKIISIIIIIVIRTCSSAIWCRAWCCRSRAGSPTSCYLIGIFLRLAADTGPHVAAGHLGEIIIIIMIIITTILIGSSYKYNNNNEI